MISTTSQVVTGEWQQVSAGDCTIQLFEDSSLYDISIGDDTPTDALTINIGEPITLAYSSAVWVRLHAKGSSSMSKQINIIK